MFPLYMAKRADAIAFCVKLCYDGGETEVFFMMKRIAMLLTAALLLCALAAAETYVDERYTLTLPEGLAPVAAADMEGYLQAAARDAGADYEGEALLAVGENAAISVVQADTAYAGTQAAAEAMVAEYADYVAGFEAVEPQYIEAGGRTFALIQVALDGETASHYLLVEDGILYTLTFVGVAEADILSTLESFAPSPAATAAPTATVAPSASAAAEEPTEEPSLALVTPSPTPAG